MKSILHNKYVLYAVFILALIDFLYLGYIQDMKSVFIFVLVGILVTFFNKNMIIVLGLAVIVTNIIKLGNIIPTPNKEGFTDKEDDDDKEEGFNDDKEEDGNEEQPDKKKKNGKKSKDDKEDKETKEDETKDETKDEKDETKDEKKTKEEFGQDKDVVYTSAEDQSVNEQEKMILANENLLKRMNKYKPLLDTLNGLTKNIAIVKGFASSVSEDVNKKI